jgi:hypothetical protein
MVLFAVLRMRWTEQNLVIGHKLRSTSCSMPSFRLR